MEISLTSEEYINQVNRLMDLQNIYLGVFLTILIAGIGLVVLFQWRFTSQQMEQLKEETKQETIAEIERDLGGSSLVELKSNMQDQIKEVERKHYLFGYNQLHFGLTNIANEEKPSLWNIVYLMDIYESSILKGLNDFNYFVSRVDSLIFIAHQEGKIDIRSQHIDNVVEKMSRFESALNESSEKLQSFKNQLSYHRNQETKKASRKNK